MKKIFAMLLLGCLLIATGFKTEASPPLNKQTISYQLPGVQAVQTATFDVITGEIQYSYANVLTIEYANENSKGVENTVLNEFDFSMNKLLLCNQISCSKLTTNDIDVKDLSMNRFTLLMYSSNDSKYDNSKLPNELPQRYWC